MARLTDPRKSIQFTLMFPCGPTLEPRVLHAKSFLRFVRGGGLAYAGNPPCTLLLDCYVGLDEPIPGGVRGVQSFLQELAYDRLLPSLAHAGHWSEADEAARIASEELVDDCLSGVYGDCGE